MKGLVFRHMYSYGGLIVLALCLAVACDQTPGIPDADPDADSSLDELRDMMDYPEGMVVDCRYFKGKRTRRLVLNHTLHKDPVSIDLSMPGYYRMEVFTGEAGEEAGIIRLVVLDPERGNSEWGLAPWTPLGVEITDIGDQDIRLVYPSALPQGSPLPLVVMDGALTSSLENFMVSAESGDFLIKRGVGSAWVLPDDKGSTELSIGHRSFPVQADPLDIPPVLLGGTLDGHTHIEQGMMVHIASDLTIAAGSVLSLGPGVFVRIDPGVNIYNAGSLNIQGEENRPVVLSCSDPSSYWGGVIGKGSGNQVEASHAIFGRSGYHEGSEYDWGHAHRQALFYTQAGSLKLRHCYMIDHIGQIAYAENATVQMEYCLVQRAMTGGQLNSSRVQIDHCIFTDFPDDTDRYRDEDNDGLYLMDCMAEISSSVFMYAKDDGIDSGGGLYDGDIRVSNTRFESIFHEGAALSGGTSAGKYQRFVNCVFQDCGQGLELGFSSKAHQVRVDSCLFIRNGIGIRYGDNYTYPNQGILTVTDSESRDNLFYDVWNMDREDWVADTASMVFHNVYVSKANPMYPLLKMTEQ